LYSPYAALELDIGLKGVHVYGINLWLQSDPPLFKNFCMNLTYDVRLVEVAITPVISLYEC
jgi:hypothetical protein